jgi:spore photoproduct lyase
MSMKSNHSILQKNNEGFKDSTHPLVSHIYAIRGKTDVFEAERIHKNCDELGVPFSWDDKIPQSQESGETKLREERGILVLIDRKSPFIERFGHPKGLCHPFYKLTAHNSCNFWCEYCYLYMTFYMRPQSLHYVNYHRMFNEIDEFENSDVKGRFRALNLGELGDPLATDDITGFSKRVIPYIANKRKTKLLFLTKSINIDNLLDLSHNNRVILSWSVNCDLIAEKLEHKAPRPIDRIRSAAKAQKAGYEIRLRIDPLFWFDGWQEQYTRLVEEIMGHIKPKLITLGAYRPSQGLVNHIRSRFPRSNLLRLEEKLVMDAGKKRFPDQKRVEMYRYVSGLIKEKSEAIKIALCKEPKRIWRASGIESKGMTCNCTDFVGT